MKWRYLRHLQLSASSQTVVAQREVCLRDEMANPPGMNFRTLCGVQLSLVIFALNSAFECNPLHRGRQGARPCVSDLRRSELSAQVGQGHS